jgi:segregation and condensation protein B
MSLKAKVEAVIYASEEPVTLAQLAGVLGEETQAELDRAESAQGSLSLNETEAELEAAAEVDPSLGVAEGSVWAEESVDSTHGVEAAINGAPSLVEPPDLGGSPERDEPLAAAALAKEEKARAARVRAHIRAVLDGLVAEYAGPDRGLEIREVAGGYRFATKPEYHDAVRGFVKSLKPPLKLTLQALETLAVVAYKQPVTAPEISEIRGVDSAGVLGSLITRKLITTAGRKQVIGRPILYKTTKDFLLKFGLRDVAELPSIEEFERMAGQMAEQEEIPMEHKVPESAEKLEPEGETHGAQADGDSTLSEETGANADSASVDGRLSGLPPVYDDADDDPSAREAEEMQGAEEA